MAVVCEASLHERKCSNIGPLAMIRKQIACLRKRRTFNLD